MIITAIWFYIGDIFIFGMLFFFACVQDIIVPSVKDLPRVVTGTYEKERGYIERIVADPQLQQDKEGEKNEEK